MKLSPRGIIYLAVCNYLAEEKYKIFSEELCSYKKLNDHKFLFTLSKYFDINHFKDKPFLEEDILLYNYLVYETNKTRGFNPFLNYNLTDFKGKLPRKGLITRHEKQIILPQLQTLKAAKRLLENGL